MDAVKEEKSLPALVSDLTRETSTLVRQEVALAKAEINEKVTQVSNGMISVVVGLGVAIAGFLVLLDAAVFALVEFFDLNAWVAALIVGLLVVIIGLIMLQAGKSKLKASHLAPHETAHSLQRDKELVKEHAR